MIMHTYTITFTTSQSTGLIGWKGQYYNEYHCYVTAFTAEDALTQFKILAQEITDLKIIRIDPRE